MTSYKSQIFYKFKEYDKISNVIQANFSNQVKNYLEAKCIAFIKYHNNKVAFKEIQIFNMPNLSDKHYFGICYTHTQTNHPYLIHINLDEPYIMFLIPFGGDKTHGTFQTFYYAIEEADYIERTCIYVLLDKTIFIRKTGIVESKQFSLFNCNNIANCVKKMQEIDKMKVGKSDKDAITTKNELKAKYNEYYIKKAYEFLKYYFTLLDGKEYNEALLFLKGKDSKYFGKERLNTFFKNTKVIIGHLEVFIPLYELLHKTHALLIGTN
jgi:hypothetical protein